MIERTESKVWDAPTRVFHWILVLSCIGAVATQESERWRLLHVTFGYTMAGMVLFRLVWGWIGTRYARFNSFVTGPTAVIAYVRSIAAKQPQHFVGHNPLGALAVVAVLTLVTVLGATGYAIYNDLAGSWAEEVHEGAANLLYLVVGGHIAGVILSSRMHQENLVKAMVTGKKWIQKGQAIDRNFGWLAAVMVVAAISFWIMQFMG